MYIRWTQHLKDEEQKKRFENEVYGSRRVLERLQQLLDEEEKTIGRQETNSTIFDQPNWYERQIFNNGYRACIGTLKKLIDLDQQQLPKENS
jgi:hypothetical protein